MKQSSLQVIPIAKTAVVIGVNHKVNIKALTYHQLCEIYNGKITNWIEIGGQDKGITPFARPFDEVDSEVLVKHVPCFNAVKYPSTIQVMQKSGQMAKVLAQKSGAIGVTTLIRVAQSQGKIIPLTLNGNSPYAKEHINEQYPLTRELFLIIKATPSPQVLSFLNFIHSDIGATTIISNSAIPMR